MATQAENLTTAANNIAATLASISASPKPTYSVDGQTVSWSEYFQMLTMQISVLRRQAQEADGPFEVRTIGVP